MTSTPGTTKRPNVARRLTDHPWRTAGECFVVAVLALGAAAWLYRVWERPFSIPYENVYDARQYGLIVKSLLAHGPYGRNPALGAPFGQVPWDFPFAGESLQQLAISFGGLFTSRYGVVMNAYFLLGFPAVAVVGYLVFRVLRFRPLVAGTVALVYAFIPYHLYHAEGHLYRSSYVSVPLACLLMLAVLSFRSVFLEPPDGRGTVRLRKPVLVGAVMLAAVVATTETMALFFTAAAIVIAAIVVALRDRSAAVLIPAGLLVATLGLVFAIALAPNLLYWHEHGGNDAAVTRIAVEQELYGLKPSQLVLPIPQHRLSALRSIADEAAAESRVPSEGGQNLGVVAALGLLAALYGAVAFGVERRSRVPLHNRRQLWQHAGLLALVLILLGTISGFAFLASLAGLVQVRTWNRVVVFLAFFGLVAVAIGLEAAIEWLRARSRRAGVIAAIGCVILVVASLWDTAVVVRLDQDEQAVVLGVAREFVRDVEAQLPDQANVYQLPIVAYPEFSSVIARRADYTAYDYEPAIPYLVSDSLRWSYGGTKGRPQSDWQSKVDALQPSGSLAGLTGLGFSGVVVDAWEYADGGVAATADLRSALGAPDLMSSDDRWLFWDLRGYAAGNGLSAKETRAAARDLVGDLIDQIPKPAN